MSDAPAPLVPAECDLRGMPFMPVDIVRLFDSDLYAISTGEEFKAAFTLWGRSFLQRPAASLPSDERVLAHLSGAGAAWKKVREIALRGWILCSDGRLYHPVVAEKAREAWSARQSLRARTEAARAARHARRDSGDKPATTENVTTSVTEAVAVSVTENVTTNATGSKGQGQGQDREERKKEIPHSPPLRADPPPKPDPRGSRLPPDWQPNDVERQFAIDLSLDLERTIADFRDYWTAKAGAGARKADWTATWRSWCRRAAESRPRPPPDAQPLFRNGAFALARRLSQDLPPGAQQTDFVGTTLEGKLVP